MNKINYISRVLNEIITLNSINYYTKEIKYFLDVGANSGMTAIAAYYLFEGQAQIYMFEPSKDCFEILLKIEKSFKSINFFPYALGEFDQTLQFNRSLSSRTSQASSFFNPTDFYKNNQEHASFKRIKESVKVLKLDSLKKKFNLKSRGNIFIHLDVEGYELNVLKGAKNLLKNSSIISLEYSNKLFDNSYTLEEINNQIKETHEFLCALGTPMKNEKGIVLVQDLVWVNKKINE